MTGPTDFRMPGAVDLGALAAAREAQARAAAAPPPPAGVVVAVTEATFQTEIIDRSMTVPVVVDFWATWCGPCKQLSPVLERLAAADGGRWVLATIDVDANQRLAQAFQIQSIPSVMAVIKGQPVPLFQGAVPEREARQVIDELLRVAAANGVTGTVGDAAATPGADEPAEPPVPPEYDEAYDAIERGDLDAAADAYRRRLAAVPGDDEARAGLAQVELLARTGSLDPVAVRAAAAAAPADMALAAQAADLDLLDGDVESAFRRLVEAVRLSSGDERAAAREHLVGLFGIVGNDDPRVVQARRDLASALF